MLACISYEVKQPIQICKQQHYIEYTMRPTYHRGKLLYIFITNETYITTDLLL